MKFLVVHPGSNVATHDVFMGLIEGLRDLGHTLHVYPLDRRIHASGKFLSDQRKIEREVQGLDLPEQVSHAEIILQGSDGLLVRALMGDYDWVIIVSGMYVPLLTMQVLRKAKIRTCLILTESPYDEEQERRWAEQADVVFSNERTTAAKLNARYLPHAWRRGVHDETSALPEMPKHDAVFVGTGFGERVAWFESYTKAGGPLTLYGTWPQPSMKPFLADAERDEWIVDNKEAASLYRNALVGLNLYRTSKGDTGFTDTPQYIAHAESMNPRAYELAALGCLHVSSPRDEVREKFGELVPITETPEQAADEVRRLMALPFEVRRAWQGRLRQAVSGDSWHDRAREVCNALA